MSPSRDLSADALPQVMQPSDPGAVLQGCRPRRRLLPQIQPICGRGSGLIRAQFALPVHTAARAYLTERNQTLWDGLPDGESVRDVATYPEQSRDSPPLTPDDLLRDKLQGTMQSPSHRRPVVQLERMP